MKTAYHSIVGVCAGIVFCAWFLDAQPADVALIRFPASMILIAAMIKESIAFGRFAHAAIRARAL